MGNYRKCLNVSKLISAVMKDWNFLRFLPQQQSWKCSAIWFLLPLIHSEAQTGGKKVLSTSDVFQPRECKTQNKKVIAIFFISTRLLASRKHNDRGREENISSLPYQLAFLLLTQIVIVSLTLLMAVLSINQCETNPLVTLSLPRAL